jgi:chromosome segregation protein
LFISRLDLSGFKSFASKTVLEFRPGVMSVVGPNGCGKTNIVDAVRWVLGEQRTGALRADRMESVIFNGTAKRRPVGLAEVTMTVENDRGILPSAYSTVEITRRLYRSGESEYLINRNPSRLRDIQDLFVDTGFGHATYSIIELSMVEGIISGSSDARRALFEEAAGVAKFKSRRNAAERRLESTKEALDRIKDVYGEVEKSYATLKRQSGRAKRHQSLSRGLQLRLLADLARERLEIVARRMPIEEQLRQLEQEVSGAESEVTRLTAELLTMEGAEISLDSRLSRAQESLKRVERREAELDGELALVKQRSAQLKIEAETTVTRREELSKAIEQAVRTEGDAGKEMETLSAQLKAGEAERQGYESKSEEVVTRLGEARRRLDGLRLQHADLERRLTADQETGRRNRAERERLTLALNDASTRKAFLSVKVVELKEFRTGKSAEEQEQKRLLGETIRTLEETSSRLDDQRTHYAEANSGLVSARGKAEAASSALNAHRSRANDVGGVPEALKSMVQAGTLKTIASRIECRHEHRAAIAATLRPVLEAYDIEDFDATVRIAEGLATGEVAALRMKDAPSVVNVEITPPEGVVPLSGLLTGEGDLYIFLKNRLASSFMVENRGELQKHISWARQHSATLVTGAGEVLEPDGVLHLGALDPEGYRIGWEGRAKELASVLREAEEKARDASVAFDQVKLNLANAEQAQQEARNANRKAEDALAATSRVLSATTADMEQAERRLKEASAELERIEGQLSTLPVESKDGQESAARLEETLAEIRGSKDKAQAEVAGLEVEQRSLSEQRAQNSADVARTTERLSQARSKLESSRREGEDATRRLAELEAKSAGSAEEQRRTTHAAESLQGQLELVRKEKGELTGTVESAKTERQALTESKTAASAALKRGQETVRQGIDRRNRLEVEAVSGLERIKEIDRRLVEDAGSQPEAIQAETPERAEAELQELELANLTLEQLKVKLQSLGPVNMLALEELAQVEERYRFLTDQRKDLEGGIELLTETIDRINHEARRKFRETFDLVDANFQNLFRTLFEGGEARISLELGDPLESDIRIWATPTGKKLQGLSMLSGGEKALTAISLLFAIYMVRPSPFCILDEVDAPLDDSNVGRFNRLIRQFSKDTQFLIVTHNKRTMEAADSLFGVTLAEDGASQLVSVRLESYRE